MMLTREDGTITTGETLGELQFDGTGGGSGQISSVDGAATIRAVAAESFGTGDKGFRWVVFRSWFALYWQPRL